MNFAATPAPAREKPVLILRITVDQLRGDRPRRYDDNLGNGGLQYLLDHGIHLSTPISSQTIAESLFRPAGIPI